MPAYSAQYSADKRRVTNIAPWHLVGVLVGLLTSPALAQEKAIANPANQTVPLAPDALRRVNPSGGGSSGFFASLDKIRTKTREDEARQLFDLAVRTASVP
jgi:hypothetical protein